MNNRPGEGEFTKDMFVSTQFDSDPAHRGLYIMGAENVNTDEYDTGVILHEFGHYVEDVLSCSDSNGDAHAIGDALDMRVAFSEAWGNAFSSMMRNELLVTDTYGPLQGDTRVVINMAGMRSPNHFWFDEDALGNLLYALYGSPDIGFAPLYRAMLTG